MQMWLWSHEKQEILCVWIVGLWGAHALHEPEDNVPCTVAGHAIIQRKWERERQRQRERETPDGERESTLECSMCNACVSAPLPQKQHSNERYTLCTQDDIASTFWNESPAPENLVLPYCQTNYQGMSLTTSQTLNLTSLTYLLVIHNKKLIPNDCFLGVCRAPIRQGWNSIQTATTQAWNFGVICKNVPHRGHGQYARCPAFQ